MSYATEEINALMSAIPWDSLDTLKVTWKVFYDQDGEIGRTKFLPEIEIKMKDEVMP